jgi:hypothetical protein
MANELEDEAQALSKRHIKHSRIKIPLSLASTPSRIYP